MRSTSASTQLAPHSSNETPETNSLAQLILPLKSFFRPAEFDRFKHTLTARDESARRETAYWKAQYEALEKKHGEEALEKIVALDDVTKLTRERDLLRSQAARAEGERRVLIERMEEDQKGRAERFREDQRAGREREKDWEERYARLWEDFNRAETERAKVTCRASTMEFERERAEREAEEAGRRFEELSKRISRLEEDAALLMSVGPTAVEERRGNVVNVADELVVDGKEEGGSGGGGDGSSEEGLTLEFVVEESENVVKESEKAEVATAEGGSGPGSAAAGTGSMVVIEIDDSDDEMPTRKRGLSNDDSEDVKPTKKRYTKSLVELMDLHGGSDSSDTGDSSSSGSDGDSKSEIARLCRKVAEKKTWANQADMMSALERESKLCMNAVCALYRKQLRKVESVSVSSLSVNQGFNQFDAIRGTFLGKYLTDGDPQGKLKRSASELEEFDPKGLGDCKKLALRNSDRLFEIYRKKQDAFFLPS